METKETPKMDENNYKDTKEKFKMAKEEFVELTKEFDKVLDEVIANDGKITSDMERRMLEVSKLLTEKSHDHYHEFDEFFKKTDNKTAVITITGLIEKVDNLFDIVKRMNVRHGLKIAILERNMEEIINLEMHRYAQREVNRFVLKIAQDESFSDEEKEKAVVDAKNLYECFVSKVDETKKEYKLKVGTHTLVLCYGKHFQQ